MMKDIKTVVPEKVEKVEKAVKAAQPAAPVQTLPPDAAITTIQGPLEKFMEAARVEAAIGAPIEHGDSLVIPTAEVFNAMGFGMGSGQAKDEGHAETGQANQAGGSGGGGGGQAMARPVAVIVMSPEGVRVEPVVDVTKIALAAFTAAGFIGAMVWRMSRRRLAL